MFQLTSNLMMQHVKPAVPPGFNVDFDGMSIFLICQQSVRTKSKQVMHLCE